MGDFTAEGVSDEAIRVVAAQLAADGWTCEYHEPGDCARCDRVHKKTAAHILAALKAAGIAVVRLPEQMIDRSNVAESIRDRAMWEVGDAWTSLTDNPGEIEFEADDQNTYGCLPSPASARDLATALLAAADATEGDR